MRSHFRSILLLVALVASGVAVFPFLGRAQESTPSASPVAVQGDAAQLARGELIFTSVCMACHQAGGAGIEGVYPKLDGNPLVTLEDPFVVTSTVLYGRGGMPRFNSIFSDDDLAAVISYVRGGLGENNAPAVTSEYVASVKINVEGSPVPALDDNVGQRSADQQQSVASPEATTESGG